MAISNEMPTAAAQDFSAVAERDNEAPGREQNSGAGAGKEKKPEVAGKVLAVCMSERKGTRKHPVDAIELEVGLGIVGDAHSGNWHRQVSLLGNESVDRMRAKGIELAAGDFAENILTQGLDLRSFPVGTMFAVGSTLLVVTQIGKKCHNDCEIRRLTGMCVMPTDGIFCVVVRGGTVKAGDAIRVVLQNSVGVL